MSDEIHRRFEEATRRDPIEFPYCFYPKDVQLHAPTLFHWYKTKADLMFAMAHDLVAAFDFDAPNISEVRDAIERIVRDTPAGEGSDDALVSRLNAYLQREGAWFRMEYIGSFQQLCEGGGDWEVELRQYFRGYGEDESLSEDDASRPIDRSERKSFAECILSYGQ